MGFTYERLYRDEGNAADRGQGCGNGRRRIGLATPGTERRVRGMRRRMVRMAAPFCLHEETTCRTDCKRGVKHDYPGCNERSPAFHFDSSRTWRTSATDSSLSQALGPTARPIARPS